MGKIKKIFSINIIKTLFFNVVLFGLSGILSPRLIVGFNCRLTIFGAKKITIPKGSRFFIGVFSGENRHNHNQITYLNVKGSINVDGRVNISKGADIYVHPQGFLSISDTYFGPDTTIVCNKSIIFQGETSVSWNCMFLDGDTHPIIGDTGSVLNPNKGIVIGKKCWIGCNSTILKGSSLPNSSIVSANSVVTKHLLEQNTIYVNNKPIKSFKTFLKDETLLFKED